MLPRTLHLSDDEVPGIDMFVRTHRSFCLCGYVGGSLRTSDQRVAGVRMCGQGSACLRVCDQGGACLHICNAVCGGWVEI